MTNWLLDRIVDSIPGCDYRVFNRVLLDLIVALWIVAVVLALIGSTTFIGHVSMLALVLSVYSALRSDEPDPE